MRKALGPRLRGVTVPSRSNIVGFVGRTFRIEQPEMESERGRHESFGAR